MQTYRRSVRLPWTGGTNGGGVERQRKRFKAAPGKTDAEQFEPVDQRSGGGAVLALQDEREQPGRAAEIARTKRMDGAGRPRRVQDPGERKSTTWQHTN